MSKKILVVDDDIELCNLLMQCLGNEGFEVNCLNNGKNVLSFLKNNQTDLVILDVMLPEVDGFTVLRRIREFCNLPVLMLSAKGDEMNKVLGLRTGADDYLTKPFGLSVMFVSIMAMVLLTYILNLSGILIGVTVTMTEFFTELKVYALAGFLIFVCILQMMLVSIVVKKGFLLSICISIVYSLGSFLASWIAPLAALLPIDVAWRIMDLQQFEMTYSFPLSVSIISLVIVTIISVIGIFYVSNKQEA